MPNTHSSSTPSTRSGIYHKLVRMFVLQMLFISVITALGVYVAAIIVEQVMIRTALESEAAHYWGLQATQPDYPTPNTHNLLGYVSHQGDRSTIPVVLQERQPGFGRIHMGEREPIVYVEDKGATRLYLIFDEESVGKLSFYFGVVPLSLSLMVIYASAWVVYKLSHRTLSPLVSLAATMRRFDLGKHPLDDLQLDAFTHAGVDAEVHALADALRVFTERLKQQLQREREFTRDVSHELRTPLAVIRGSLEVLAKRQDWDARQHRALERIQVTSRDMLSLIETLLVLAREENTRAPAEAVVVNDVVRLLLEQIESTHNTDQHVHFKVEESKVLQVAAPAQVLGVVLGNVLRNACNYTQQGSITLQIAAGSVTISDTGLGMVDVAQAQQAFVRQTGEGTGFGLGLDIVRRLCERFGWQLQISSDVTGTKVVVVFADGQAKTHV